MPHKQKSLFRNSIYFILYRLINVLYPLLTITYVSRILKPSGIGEVSFAQNIVIFLVALSLLGIPNYGVREISKNKSKSDEGKIFSELFVINFCSTIIITTLYYGIINLLELPINKTLFNIEGIILLLNMFNVDWFYQGKEEFRYITLRSAVVKLISLFAVFMLVKNESDICTYAIIFSLAYAGNYILNVINLRKYIKISFRDISPKRHLKPVMLLAITYISNEIYVTIDTVMLGIMTTNSQVGFYTNSMKMIRILINVCTALGTAMLPRLSKLKSEKDIKKVNGIIYRGINALLWFTIPCAIGMALISNELVKVLFGNEFEPSGAITVILSILVIIRPFSNLFLQVLVSSAKDSRTTIAYLLGMTSNIVLNAILIIKYDAIGAATASILSELLILIILYNFAKKEIRYTINTRFFTSLFLSIFAMITNVYFIKQFIHDDTLLLFAEITTGVICFLTINLITKNEVLNLIINKFIKGVKNKCY